MTGNDDSVEAKQQSLTRRRLLESALATGAGIALVGPGSAYARSIGRTAARSAAATTPAQRAVKALKAMKLSKNFTLRVFGEDLSLHGIEQTKDKFTAQTGVKLKFEGAPAVSAFDKLFNDVATKAGLYDVVLSDPGQNGDLWSAGYSQDLTGWSKQYGLRLLQDIQAPLGQLLSTYAGHLVSVPIDGDIFMFHYRKDLIQDPKNQTDFKAKYNRPLAVPQSWDDYNQVAEFFTRPSDNLYGAVEWRAKGLLRGWFFQRLWAAGGQYFDANMNAAVNSPAGVRALSDLKAIQAYMPQDVATYGYVETVAAMQNGTTFSNISWPAAGKNANDPKQSKTAGKWGWSVMPTYRINGRLNKFRAQWFGGNNLVVSRHGRNPLAAYLFIQWFASPENLLIADLDLAGNTDVLRTSIFKNPKLLKAFDGASQFYPAQLANLSHFCPYLWLRGEAKYVDVFENEASDFMTGGKSAKEALDNTAQAWNKITTSIGKKKQRADYLRILNAVKG